VRDAKVDEQGKDADQVKDVENFHGEGIAVGSGAHANVRKCTDNRLDLLGEQKLQ
jgi:hypothetical protein